MNPYRSKWSETSRGHLMMAVAEYVIDVNIDMLRNFRERVKLQVDGSRF